MNLTTIHDRERYGFLWSEVRLVIAAVALLIGGVPPIYLIAPPSLLGIARLGLVICWIISGLIALYLMYQWHLAGHKLFGKKDTKDAVAFVVMGVSGINLGLAGILSKNFGMSIMSGRLVFLLTAAVYIYVAYHLYTRWKAHGERLF